MGEPSVSAALGSEREEILILVIFLQKYSRGAVAVF